MELNKFLKLLYKRKYVLVIVPLITVFITFSLVRKLADTYKSHSRLSTGLVDQSQQILQTSDQTQESIILQQFSNLLEVFRLKRIFDQVSYQLMIHDLTSDKPYRSPSKLVNDLTPSARAIIAKVPSQQRIYQIPA